MTLLLCLINQLQNFSPVHKSAIIFARSSKTEMAEMSYNCSAWAYNLIFALMTLSK